MPKGSKTKTRPMRERRLIDCAISGLREYYSCLSDEAFVKELELSVAVPNSGHAQTDYECVRDEVERAIYRKKKS
jgi:hypothetical protein